MNCDDILYYTFSLIVTEEGYIIFMNESKYFF